MNFKRLPVALCAALLPTLAHADVVMTVSGFPGPVTEGNLSSPVTFTVTNNFSVDLVTIGDSMHGLIYFDGSLINGDSTDAIFQTASTSDTTCTQLTASSGGGLLDPGASCVFSIQFSTVNPIFENPGLETDNDFGQWSISAFVPWYQQTGGSASGTASANVFVDVVDVPYSPPPPSAPEPSAFTLLSTALGAIGFMARKRRFSRPRS